MPASVPPGKSKADFLACLQAFSCKGCGPYGAAAVQCVGCGKALCRGCAGTCGQEDVSMSFGDACLFALCGDCGGRHSLGMRDFIRREGQQQQGATSGFVLAVCTKCPEQLRWCPAHAEIDFLTCFNCHEQRCLHHCFEPPILQVCLSCYMPVCQRAACVRATGRFLHFCVYCYMPTCSECVNEEGGRCGQCESRVY